MWSLSDFTQGGICLLILLLSYIDCDCQGYRGIKQFKLKVVNLSMHLAEEVQNPYAC